MNGLEPDKSSPILVPNLADRHAKPSLRRSFSKICTAGCILPLAQTRSPALNGASRVISSVGRALRLHRRCREFEPLITHHFILSDTEFVRFHSAAQSYFYKLRETRIFASTGA
jgi:hypothetical protein